MPQVPTWKHGRTLKCIGVTLWQIVKSKSNQSQINYFVLVLIANLTMCLRVPQ